MLNLVEIIMAVCSGFISDIGARQSRRITGVTVNGCHKCRLPDKFSPGNLKFNFDRIELHWDSERSRRHDGEDVGGHLKVLTRDLDREVERNRVC